MLKKTSREKEALEKKRHEQSLAMRRVIAKARAILAKYAAEIL